MGTLMLFDIKLKTEKFCTLVHVVVVEFFYSFEGGFILFTVAVQFFFVDIHARQTTRFHFTPRTTILGHVVTAHFANSQTVARKIVDRLIGRYSIRYSFNRKKNCIYRFLASMSWL